MGADVIQLTVPRTIRMVKVPWKRRRWLYGLSVRPELPSPLREEALVFEDPKAAIEMALDLADREGWTIPLGGGQFMSADDVRSGFVPPPGAA